MEDHFFFVTGFARACVFVAGWMGLVVTIFGGVATEYLNKAYADQILQTFGPWSMFV